MKLIGSVTSPFVRKARIVLAEKRIDYEFEIDIPWSEDTRVGHYNPLGKVPVLVMEDDETLFDSRVIVEYLDTITPVSRLIPEVSRQRIQVKRWEALADGTCDAAAAIFLERKRAPEMQSQEWIARQKKKIDQGLNAMAIELGERHWCMGEGYSLADIAVGCCLGYLDFRFPEIKWREEYPNLAKLFDKLMKRASFSETAPAA